MVDQSIHMELHEAVNNKASLSTRTALITKATSRIHDFVNDSTLDAAMHVLDSFAELGKSMPFVAPAFIVLKIIIDIEKCAQDVDAKCSDLLERITFMLGHLPALQNVELTPAMHKVIDRINEALKSAAALITTYRKQGRVARRLSFSNREKFTACAEAINDCCRDLLIGLQIHHTVKLDILTREVPIDEEDKAAKLFIEEHGGSPQTVLHDRKLVKEFAQQRHIIINDLVMEQLSINITDTVNHHYAQLEDFLRDNIHIAITNGLKGVTMEINAIEAEQKFQCIQCDKEFTTHKNGPQSCSFHRAEYNSWSKTFPCCSTLHPCQFGAHRIKHHCEYPYSTFFPRARAILHYANTMDIWVEVEDTNLENDNKEHASASQLLRWVSNNPRIEENIVLITVGTATFDQPFYFNTFTAKELQDMSNSVQLTGRTLIFRTSSNESEYAIAEWVLTCGRISGIRLVAKCASSDAPCVRMCPIDIVTCTKPGEATTLSEGGFYSYTPSSPYILPDVVRFGPTLDERRPRLPRKNFKTKTASTFSVILKESSPLRPSRTLDAFSGMICVFNNALPHSSQPITIFSASASYRMVGNSSYSPVQMCIVEGLENPVTIEPRQNWMLNFRVIIPRIEDDDSRVISAWWDHEYLCRHRPIRIRIIVTDITGEEASLVLEHVFKPYPFKKPSTSDIAFFYCDDPQVFNRHTLNVRPSSGDQSVLNISTYNININMLQKAVYRALKVGETEILLLNVQSQDGTWEWSAWALVNVSCRRVYAVKIVLNEKVRQNVPNPRFGCIGYVLCPSYGRVAQEIRQISYAIESVKFPTLESQELVYFPQDDQYDDIAPNIQSESESAEVSLSFPPPTIKQKFLPHNQEIQTVLTSIDIQLRQISYVLEKLLVVLILLTLINVGRSFL